MNREPLYTLPLYQEIKPEDWKEWDYTPGFLHLNNDRHAHWTFKCMKCGTIVHPKYGVEGHILNRIKEIHPECCGDL